MRNTYMTRTVHVMLDVDEDTRTRLESTLDIYARVYNRHAEWAVEHRSTNTTRAHKDLYRQLRSEFPTLPSAMIQAARDHAFGNVKSYNSNNPDNKWGHTPIYRAHSCLYNRLTVSLNTMGKLTFSLEGGKRGVAHVTIPQYFTDRYGAWQFNTASVGIDRAGNVFANLSYRTTPPHPRGGRTVGVDRGIYNIATTSDGNNYSSRHVRGIKRKYRHNMASLQAQIAHGSRSAKRRLVAQRGREARFNRNELTRIVNTITSDESIGTIVLEDLTGLHQKKTSKSFNRLKHTWSPALFRMLMQNKCEMLGIQVVLVDPAYTSQTCNQCGHVEKKNRDKSRFVCQKCGHTAHADVNAAQNIRDKYLSTLPEHDCLVYGRVLSTTHNAPNLVG